MNGGRLIAVEGCIGVGKTTWAKAIAEARNAKLALEEFDKNPFLEAFYADRPGNALETELHFLLVHFHQLKNIQKQKSRETVADFALFKDTIFSQLNLKGGEENEIFKRLYHVLAKRLDRPDLVIYLRGSNDLILNRIQQRNRALE